MQLERVENIKVDFIPFRKESYPLSFAKEFAAGAGLTGGMLEVLSRQNEGVIANAAIFSLLLLATYLQIMSPFFEAKDSPKS